MSYCKLWQVLAGVVCLLAFTTSYADSTGVKSNEAGSATQSAPTNYKFQAYSPFQPSNGNLSYVANQNCNSGAQQYTLGNGSNYIVVPYSGTYSVNWWMEAYNNNGGSVEWNTIQVLIKTIAPASGSSAVTQQTTNEGQDGGGCNSCSQYNHSYMWTSNVVTTQLTAGTKVYLTGQVTQSGTGCGGNSVLIQAGGIGLTQQ